MQPTVSSQVSELVKKEPSPSGFRFVARQAAVAHRRGPSFQEYEGLIVLGACKSHLASFYTTYLLSYVPQTLRSIRSDPCHELRRSLDGLRCIHGGAGGIVRASKPLNCDTQALGHAACRSMWFLRPLSQEPSKPPLPTGFSGLRYSSKVTLPAPAAQSLRMKPSKRSKAPTVAAYSATLS